MICKKNIFNPMTVLALSTGLMLQSSFVLAEESHYLVNNNPAKGEVEVSYARQNQINNSVYNQSTKTNSNQFQLKYTHSFNENLSASVNSSFSFGQRSYAQQSGSDISGMGDLFLGLKAGTVFEPLTMVYGADLGISPGAAKNSSSPSAANGITAKETEGNFFSGHNQIHPFIGAESYYKNIALGARFTYAYYSVTSIESANGNNSTTPEIEIPRAAAYRLQGFVEFPIDKKADIGFIAGIGREDGNLIKFVDRAKGSEYLAKIYSNYHVDKDTTAVLAFESNNSQVPYEVNNSSIQLGLRRSL